MVLINYNNFPFTQNNLVRALQVLNILINQVFIILNSFLQNNVVLIVQNAFKFHLYWIVVLFLILYCTLYMYFHRITTLIYIVNLVTTNNNVPFRVPSELNISF